MPTGYTETITADLVKIAIDPTLNAVTVYPTAAWDKHNVTINAYRSTWANPNGCDVKVLFPDSTGASALPVGWRARVKRTDPVAGYLRFTVQGSDRVNHFWDASHPYGIHVAVVQDWADIWYSGAFDGPLYHNNGNAVAPFNEYQVDPGLATEGPTELLSIGTSSRQNYTLTPSVHRKMIGCDPVACGGYNTLWIEPSSIWLPPSPFTDGNYLQRWFDVQRLTESDATGTAPGGNATIIASTSQIHGRNGGFDGTYYYHYLVKAMETCRVFVRADGMWIIEGFRPAWVAL